MREPIMISIGIGKIVPDHVAGVLRNETTGAAIILTTGGSHLQTPVDYDTVVSAMETALEPKQRYMETLLNSVGGFDGVIERANKGLDLVNGALSEHQRPDSLAPLVEKVGNDAPVPNPFEAPQEAPGAEMERNESEQPGAVVG